MTIEDDVALLERVPTLRMLGREALRVLAIGAESRTLHAGEALFREGETADCGYVIEEGLLTCQDPETGRTVNLSRGALLGEMALLIETRRPITVTAAEPSSVMRIPRALFLRTLEGYPEAAERLRETMADRTERLTSELGSVRDVLDLADAFSSAYFAEDDSFERDRNDN